MNQQERTDKLLWESIEEERDLFQICVCVCVCVAQRAVISR
jgi:hypothetical protein